MHDGFCRPQRLIGVATHIATRATSRDSSWHLANSGRGRAELKQRLAAHAELIAIAVRDREAPGSNPGPPTKFRIRRIKPTLMGYMFRAEGGFVCQEGDEISARNCWCDGGEYQAHTGKDGGHENHDPSARIMRAGRRRSMLAWRAHRAHDEGRCNGVSQPSQDSGQRQ